MTRPKHRPRSAPKRGLTKAEARQVERTTKADRDRWNILLAKPLNKWTVVK